jgi:uncharacterized protein (DUF1697 family)
MPRHVVLLRGINLVKRNRIAMPQLRAVLESAGYRDVVSYVQSGNVVLSSRASQQRVAVDVKALIETHFGLDITILVRSREEVAAVVQRNPLAAIATNTSHYLVTVLSQEMPAGFADDLAGISKKEPFAVIGREIYSWHPDGIGRTPLWDRLASKSLGVAATSRNWTTVKTLLAMATRE